MLLVTMQFKQIEMSGEVGTNNFYWVSLLIKPEKIVVHFFCMQIYCFTAFLLLIKKTFLIISFLSRKNWLCSMPESEKNIELCTFYRVISPTGLLYHSFIPALEYNEEGPT